MERVKKKSHGSIPLISATQTECHPFEFPILRLIFSSTLHAVEWILPIDPLLLVRHERSSLTIRSLRHPNALLYRLRPREAMRTLQLLCVWNEEVLN